AELPSRFTHTGVEGEPADDEDVEADASHRLFGCLLDVGGTDGSVFGAYGDGHPLGLAFLVRELTGCLEPGAGERLEGVEGEALTLLGVLDASFAKVGEHGGDETFSLRIDLGGDLRGWSLLVGIEHPMGR